MTGQKLKRLPLGISTFSELIKENYVYVDKTEYIYQMVTGGKYYFLSRPRRFGKSLLVSTLAELFAGNKELFKDLWIANSDYNWQKHPVIQFDFSRIDYKSIEAFNNSLIYTINLIASRYEINVVDSSSIKDKFYDLILKTSDIDKVVVLIDEYDKPILDYIDSPNEAKTRREVLKSLYSVIKSSDQYIRFVLFTGVSKFAKTSVFSGINNLRDISLSEQYATLLGYTQEELVNNFAAHLEKLAPKLGETVVDVIKNMHSQYDGYQFANNSEQLFNPYSVLTCLIERVFGDYWFETGTPTFLINLIKTGKYALNRLYQPVMSAQELGAFEPDDIKITALLYQTGYLTIKEYDKITRNYTLDFPNHEVANAFNLLIASSFTQLTHNETKTYAARIAQAFSAQAFDELQSILQSLFNEMPYNVHINREFDLHIIIFSIFKLIGLEVDPEVTTSLGRADLVVSFPKFVFVIELKFNQSAQDALTQIQDKKYYEKYLDTGKQITLLGINFDQPTKTVSLQWCAI